MTATLDLSTIYRTPLGLECRVVPMRGVAQAGNGDVKLVYLLSGETFTLSRANAGILTAMCRVPVPCIGDDPLCPCQDGMACHYKDVGNTKGWPIP